MEDFLCLNTNPNFFNVSGSFQNLDSDNEIEHKDNKPSPFLGLIDSLTENVLLHPLIIIRRQAQINNVSKCYQLSPHSVIHTLVKLAYSQGIGSLWKGLPNILLVNGLFNFGQMVFDYGLNFNPIASKVISAALITPLFVSSSFETVQSSVIGYTPDIWEFFKERNFGYFYRQSSNDTRLLSFRIICIPTIVYHGLHFCITSFFWKKDCLDKNFNTSYNELKHKLLRRLWADLLLFPLELIIQRLYIQGTRVLIDNFDSIDNVLPVNFYYESATDCFYTILHEEGFWGLFKGLGAIILQYYLHYKILNLAKFF